MSDLKRKHSKEELSIACSSSLFFCVMSLIAGILSLQQGSLGIVGRGYYYAHFSKASSPLIFWFGVFVEFVLCLFFLYVWGRVRKALRCK